jgi:hypothetical protein
MRFGRSVGHVEDLTDGDDGVEDKVESEMYGEWLSKSDAE